MIFATARPGTHTMVRQKRCRKAGSATLSTFAPGLESIQNYRKHSVFSAVHRKAYQKSSSAGTVEACLLSRFPYFPRLRPQKTFNNTVFFCTFSVKLARLREQHPQHPPHHRPYPHQCPPWMRTMQVIRSTSRQKSPEQIHPLAVKCS